VALYGANAAALIGRVTLHAHGEIGLSEDELLVLLAAGALH